MLKIKVLGPGCANCKRLEQITRKAVEGIAPDAEIVKITDYSEMADLGVMSTPGLIINGLIVSTGRVPALEEVSTWVREAFETT